MDKILAEFWERLKMETTLTRRDSQSAKEVLIKILSALPSKEEITKNMIVEWAEGKVYQEEELKAINDCCKWLHKENNII